MTYIGYDEGPGVGLTGETYVDLLLPYVRMDVPLAATRSDEEGWLMVSMSPGRGRIERKAHVSTKKW